MPYFVLANVANRLYIFFVASMGVKNLNILLNLYKNEQTDVPTTMYLAVIDGNNMLITFLQSAIKNLSYGIDIVKQTENIICMVYERVIKELDKFVRIYNLKEVWVVFDPRKKLEYNIDADLFNLIDIEYFKNKYNSDKFVLSSKDTEHIKRQKSRQYSEKTFNNPLEKELYGYQNQRIANKLVKMLQKTLVNASRFTNGCNWLDEDYDYLTNKYKMKEDYKLYIVQGEHTEADLIIKNLIEMFNVLHPNDNFLVISKDTDYKILFSNLANVWCSELNCNRSDIISPYLTWSNFFKPLTDKHPISPTELYNMVIRLAPLIGNDYTAGYSSIITLRNDSNMNLPILKLFDKDINAPINCRTNLGKFLLRYHYGNTLDENIKMYDSELYSVYIESVVIYTNWLMFGNDFAVNTKHINFDENLKLIYNIVLLPEFSESMKAKDENDFVNLFYAVHNDDNKELDEYLDAMGEDNEQPTKGDPIANEFDDYFDAI